MKKAVAYIRVSTSQYALDGVSLDVQKERIRMWCRDNDYELVNIHTDKGISGGSMLKRPVLEKTFKQVEREGCSLFIVYSLSRMCRSISDTARICERLDGLGCELFSIVEQLETKTAAGRFFFNMISSANQFQRDLACDRVSDAVRHKLDKGEKVGVAPYGFKWTGKKGQKQLVKNDAEQAVHDDLVEMRQQGCSIYAIAKELNRQRIPTRKGGVWKQQTVKQILDRAQ